MKINPKWKKVPVEGKMLFGLTRVCEAFSAGRKVLHCSPNLTGPIKHIGQEGSKIYYYVEPSKPQPNSKLTGPRGHILVDDPERPNQNWHGI